MEHDERMRRREERREAGKGGLMIFGIIIVAILLIALMAFGTTWGKLQMDKFFKPKFKEVERDVWEETPSRVLGAQQEIAKSMVEYNNAEDDIEKKAICAYLRNSYPDLTPEKFNDQRLASFFEKCKYGG